MSSCGPAGLHVMPMSRGNCCFWSCPGQVEGQKADQARLQAEQAALSKLDRIRIDQTGRAEALDREAKDAEAKVRLLICSRPAYVDCQV
jgi:hypothetical protein